MTTSETANRPPGFNTRKASRNTRSLSPERLMTQLQITTSTELSGSGIFSISPLRNSTFSDASFPLILPRESEHLVRHIEAVGFSGRANATRREQNIDTAARAEIEHSFSGVQLRQRGWVAAAERGQNSFLRQRAGLRTIIKVRGYRVAAPSVPADGPQQAPPPLWTRNAACPYFSLTASLISISSPFFESSSSSQHPGGSCAPFVMRRSPAQRHNRFRFNGFVAGAAFGVEEA